MDNMNALYDDIEKYMENNRECNGINSDLERHADLSPKEISSIEWFLLYSSTDGDYEIDAIRSGFKKTIMAFQGTLSQKKHLANRLDQFNKSYKTSRNHTIIIIIFISFLIAILTFSNQYISVDPHEGTVYSVQTKWWGLSENYTEIIWTQVDGYDYQAWVTRSNDGGLYPVIFEDYDTSFEDYNPRF